jgi:hypothetical protein
MEANPKPSRTSSQRTTLRLVLLSDTHQLHREVDVPDGDIVIHAGDFTLFSESMQAVVDFNDWLGELPHRYKIVVPGNHEFFLEADLSSRFMLDNAIVLINEGIEIEAMRIWGSPVTPLYGAPSVYVPQGIAKGSTLRFPGTSMSWSAISLSLRWPTNWHGWPGHFLFCLDLHPRPPKTGRSTPTRMTFCNFSARSTQVQDAHRARRHQGP